MRGRKDIEHEHKRAAERGWCSDSEIANTAILEMEVLLDIRDLLIETRDMLRSGPRKISIY